MPDGVDRRTVLFPDKHWKIDDSSFQLAVIIDDELKFFGRVDKPWVEKQFRQDPAVTAEDLWEIVDHVNAR